MNYREALRFRVKGVFELYLLELGRCKHYELKCSRYLGSNKEKYERYWYKYQQHKKLAEKYYMNMKELAVFTDFMEDESIFTDSSFFSNG